MGCGASKQDDNFNAVAQAIVDMEKEKAQKQQAKEAKVTTTNNSNTTNTTSTTKTTKTTNTTMAKPPMKEQHPTHNIEPDRGFHHMSIFKPDFIVDAETEKKEAPRLAKQASAATLVRPPMGPKTQKTEHKGVHHIRNVFAKPLDDNDVSSFLAPRFEKSEDELEFLRKAMRKNFVFTNLSERQLKTMLDAFEQVVYEANATIMKQGDEGEYFFVIRDGHLHYDIDGVRSNDLHAGQSFGELALMYDCPRAASVISDSRCVLFRVDQKTFRYIMQTQREHAEHDKRVLLQGVAFLKDIDETDIRRLAEAMIPRKFAMGEFLAKKGDPADTFYIIQEGKVRVTDPEEGQTKYQDHDLGPGEHFGETSLLKDERRPANYIGKGKGIALMIEKTRFHELLGNFADLIHKSQDKKRLAAIKLIQNTYLTGATLANLASKIVDRKVPPRTKIMLEGTPTPAALYLVRSGSVEFSRSDGRGQRVVKEGGYFGDDTLTADLNGNADGVPNVPSKFTVTTQDEETVLGVLTLEECRMLIDTTMIGKGQRTDFTSIVDENIPLKSLKKHTMLGAGTFGQVWLVSKVAPDGTNRPYALKIQSKYELIKQNQANGVIRERNIMAQLKSPFLIRLVQTYQDEHFVYMLLGLVQGGELYNVMHGEHNDTIEEKDAKFYAAGILEGLAYLHRRQIVYRDLKPENILIAHGGYPVIVDLGFAKIVETKTYTLCGTPLYMAPEVILNQGHNMAADHWALATLIYEMISGYTPFYVKGMDQITLYRFVVKGEFNFPPRLFSPEAKSFIKKVLVGDPRKRLGSLAGGLGDLFNDPWFKSIDFSALRRRELEAPWVPTIRDPLDPSKFDSWDHVKVKSKDDYPRLPAKAQALFKDF